ncbi:MAG: tRNA (guanosine(46)-N7)-methyltransferase TrmB [Flavobacteriales bacterium]|nr:tRNA (guanosine(46)-N7)-methyltransferase TrmB [Flavobacteriales bacterium]
MVGKNKLRKFSEMENFENVIQPETYHLTDDISLKGKWNTDFFKNENPIVLELGCGKGEYSVSLAERYPEKNFIGIDIKGNRMWKGATDSIRMGLENIAFLRIRIENIEKCFSENEISEIWITFPDPQIKKRREKKRLTHPVFLKKYSSFLQIEGIINLKTDSQFLYGYTLGIIEGHKHKLLDCVEDIYGVHQLRQDMDVKTHYEKIYLEKETPITYTKFRLK